MSKQEITKDIKVLAREILTKDNILIGYELEDGELSNHRSQVLVRPISLENFKEIWEHGRKYCSKMIIYLKSGDLFVERRPDMLNYNSKEDPMYNNDIIKGALEINKETEEVFDLKTIKNSTNNKKRQLKERIEWIVNNLVEVKKLSDDNYNIIYIE